MKKNILSFKFNTVYSNRRIEKKQNLSILIDGCIYIVLKLNIKTNSYYLIEGRLQLKKFENTEYSSGY